MAEGGKEAKLKLVSRAAIAAKVATKGFLQMGPRDVIEDSSRQILCLHEIVTCVVFHHTSAEVIAAASGETAATNDKKTCGGRKGESRRGRETWKAEVGCSAGFVTQFVQTIGVGDKCSRTRVVILV
jgi:hypothetical protein